MNKIQFKRTRAEERVLIFRDIIAQLRARRFVARAGTYLTAPVHVPAKNEPMDARDLLPEMGLCRVCQRGAVVMAMIARHDQLIVPSYMEVEEEVRWVINRLNHEYVAQLFTGTQMLLMECAFEQHDRWLVAFGSHTDRMDAICRNGIANKGTFKISQIPAPRRVPLSVEIARRAK